MNVVIVLAVFLLNVRQITLIQLGAMAVYFEIHICTKTALKPLALSGKSSTWTVPLNSLVVLVLVALEPIIWHYFGRYRYWLPRCPRR